MNENPKESATDSPVSHPEADDPFDRFASYVTACDDENLEHHTFHMWQVHGEPEGPLG